MAFSIGWRLRYQSVICHFGNFLLVDSGVNIESGLQRHWLIWTYDDTSFPNCFFVQPWNIAAGLYGEKKM